MVNRHWVFGLGLVILLAGCNRAEAPQTGQVNDEAAVDEQAEQFLAERGLTLPAGVERTSLSGTEGSGIATREITEAGQTYSVIADLEPVASGVYAAWLRGADGTVINLGQMSYEKGGFMIEKVTNEDWSGYQEVLVSLEMGAAEMPTAVALTGNF